MMITLAKAIPKYNWSSSTFKDKHRSTTEKKKILEWFLHYRIEDLLQCTIPRNVQRNREVIQSKGASQNHRTYSLLNERFPVSNDFPLMYLGHHVRKWPMLSLHWDPKTSDGSFIPRQIFRKTRNHGGIGSISSINFIQRDSMFILNAQSKRFSIERRKTRITKSISFFNDCKWSRADGFLSRN